MAVIGDAEAQAWLPKELTGFGRHAVLVGGGGLDPSVGSMKDTVSSLSDEWRFDARW
jgi:hypothetical protein